MRGQFAIITAVVGLAIVSLAASAMAWKNPELNDQPLQVGSTHLVSLMVDPASGNILLPPEGRGDISGSFDFVEAECLDCTGAPGDTGCPGDLAKTVRVTLQANSAVGAGWGVSDLSLIMTTDPAVTYPDGQGDLSAGATVRIDVETTVVSCSHWFKVFFDMCDIAHPTNPLLTCPVGTLIDDFSQSAGPVSNGGSIEEPTSHAIGGVRYLYASTGVTAEVDGPSSQMHCVTTSAGPACGALYDGLDNDSGDNAPGVGALNQDLTVGGVNDRVEVEVTVITGPCRINFWVSDTDAYRADSVTLNSSGTATFLFSDPAYADIDWTDIHAINLQAYGPFGPVECVFNPISAVAGP